MKAGRAEEAGAQRSGGEAPETALPQQQQLQQILDNTRDAIFQIDLQGGFLFANAAAERLSGYTPEELLSLNLWALVVQDYHALVRDRLQQRAAGAVADSSLEVEIWRKDRRRVWLELNLSSVKDATERLVAVHGEARDITQRKRAEVALHGSKQYLQHIIDNTREVIFQIDLQGRFVFVNATAEKFSGYTPDQLLQMRIVDVVAPAYHELVHDRLRQRIAGNIAESSVDFEIRHRDGHQLWAELTTSGVVDAEAQLIALQGVVRDITARKRAELAVQASKHYLQRIIDTTREVIFQIDLKGNFIFANAAATRLSGYTPEQLMHMNVLDVVTADYHPLVLSRLQARAAGHSAESDVEFLIRHEAGHSVWAELTTSGVLDADGQLVAVQAVVRDITARKRAELAVHGSQQHLQRIIDNTREVIFQIDLQGRFLFANATAERLSGFTPEQLLGMNVLDVVAPEYHELVRARLHQRSTGQVAASSVEFEIRCRDASRVWAELTTSGVVDAQGQLTAVQGVVRDISERKRAEEALRASQALYCSLVEHLPQCVFRKDREGRFLFCNQRFADDVGRPVAEILGQTDAAFFPPHLAQAYRQDDLSVMETGQTLDKTEEHRTVEGRKMFVQIVKTPLRDAAGAIVGIQGIFWDISERLRTDASAARLAMAVEQAAEPIVITDAEARILYVNPAFEQITGYTRRETYGQNPRLLKSGKQDLDFYRRMWATLGTGQVWHGHFINRRKDGSLIEEEATISPVLNAEGVVSNYVAVQRDVTREVALEAQNRQAAKMEAVGRLASGVAHDFNNQLLVMRGFTEIVLAHLPPDHPLQEDLHEIQQAARRSADLVRQLLTFSRQQTIAPVELDVNAAISGSLKMLGRLIGENIRLHFVPQPDLGHVFMDPSQLDQIVANLAVNARDAIADTGHLFIETALRRIPSSDQPAQGTAAAPGDYVVLTFRDDGAGMTPEIQSHIFEPFFTTKGVGKGTGMGLATVYGIVTQNNGTIAVHSAPGQGATFTICLPRSSEAACDATTETAECIPPGTETILLAEDEASALNLIQSMLKQQGYKVLPASTAAEALRLCEHHAEPIHLLLTDVVMPELGGKGLAERVQVLRPGIRVLYMSGYPEDSLERHGHLPAGLHVMQKPFTAAALAQRIRAALDAPPTPPPA